MKDKYMRLKRLIFNLLLSYSRAKLKRGLSIYGVRSDYHLFAKFISLMTKKPSGVEISNDQLGEIDAVKFTPENVSDRVILFIHGGAFVIGLNDIRVAYLPFLSQLAKDAGATVYLNDYRNAPEHAFPTALNDCISSYQGLLDTGVKPENICIMGDSCGAGIALSMTMYLRDHQIALPGCVATISAWTDLSLTANSLYTRSDVDPMFRMDPIQGFANHYLQGESPRDPLASPLYGEFKDFPPMYMMVGGREMLYDDTTRVAEKARKAGVEVTLDIKDDMIHIYPVFFGFIPEGRAAIERLGAYVVHNCKPVKGQKNRRRVG